MNFREFYDLFNKKITTFEELVDILNISNISYDLSFISKAYEVASNAHRNQYRISGESYEIHFLNVAKLIALLKLDEVSIVCALLHDVVEKGNLSLEQIDKDFGTEVAFIIDGLTTIKSLSQKYSSFYEETSNNIKDLILAATDDVRIVIIRISEKLDNILNITNVNTDIVVNSANKIMNIYAPLCEYLGLGYFKRVLEDNAFKVLYKEEYDITCQAINSIVKEKGDILEEFKEDLQNLLKKAKIDYLEVQTRVKSLYSSYLKVKRKYTQPTNTKITIDGFKKLKDLLAARIILKTVEECYMAIGLVHFQWEHDPTEYDDYIMKPKENGYRSIQSAIIYKDCFLEIQIRTQEMHEYNEFGPASHIAYKMLSSKKNSGNTFTWTKDLIRWKNANVVNNDVYKIKVFANSVFVFTPKGLLIRLPKGATPLDFAFRIHTEIGIHYGGALVNGKMVNKQYTLNTGDTVEILLSAKPTVNVDWLKLVKTQSAKQKIKRYLNAK
ncbi:MAG: HD domain-containing protein [Candidatus Dojkabacteria bacterium]|nr:HD domain-containing protein [Candidatus Dojkabacteria bacterium]